MERTVSRLTPGGRMGAMSQHKTLLILLCVTSAAVVGCAEVKSAGRTVGHTTRDVTRDIGHGTRDAAKDVAKGTKEIVK
jgi:hypothetical protein